MSLGGNSIVISDTNIALKTSISKTFEVLLNDLSKKENKDLEGKVNLQSIILKSDSIFPYKATTKIQLANETTKSVQVTKMNNYNSFNFYVPDKVEFSLVGNVRKQEVFKELLLHEQFKLIAKPLHTGEIMGLSSIIIYFLISIIGCLLPITGFVIWWKRIR